MRTPLSNAFISVIILTNLVGCHGARKVRYHKAMDASRSGGGADSDNGIFGFLGMLASSFEEEQSIDESAGGKDFVKMVEYRCIL